MYIQQLGKKHHGFCIEVLFEDEIIWVTQRMMSELFDCDVPNITQHLKQLYDSEELNEEATIKDFLIVQNESNRQVKRKTKLYRLDTVIAVGYRVNSDRAVQICQCAITIFCLKLDP